MRDLNELINERITLYSILTLLISIALTVGQIFYLRSFFKAKKVI